MASVTTFDTGAAKYGIAVMGISSLQDVAELSGKVEIAARRAVNLTLDRTRTAAAQKIIDGVAFPASYLNPGEGRLAVKQYASGADLSGVIGARVVPTSLARFVVGSSGRQRDGGGVQVMVKPGRVVTVAGGFMIPLANGNRGLAVRSNGPPPRAWKPKSIGGGLWLLYGPSVSQAFGEVRVDVAPAAADTLELEFNRQMDL